MPVRVLLADDHAVVREGTRRILAEHEDLDVVGEASDGFEAVNLAARLQPDVVLLDLSMPRLSGVEAIVRLRAACPAARILVLSAYDSEQYVFAALRAGAHGFLLKEASAAEVVGAVQVVAAGGTAWGSRVAQKIARGPGPEVPLSPRELEVLRLAAEGLSNKEIAHRLALSPRTVQAHLANIFQHIGVTSRTEAVMQALRRGWIQVR